MALEGQLALPDDILKEIFLRLPTASDLARASMTSSSFRRIITGHSFLRRFRTVHLPPLLGIIFTPFIPAQPPHPSAAAASTLANTDFSYSFLPSRERWNLRDFRDGRALLTGVLEGSSVGPDDYDPHSLAMEFAVCDSLHARYHLVPTIPDNLVALVDQSDIVGVDSFLSPSSEYEEDASFRVMCLVLCTTKLVLFVFSSDAGQWHTVTFDGWSALIAGSDFSDLCNRYYVHKCFCWPMLEVEKMLMLDMHSLKFSSINLPPSPRIDNIFFVEAAEGRLGMFAFSDYGEFEYEYHLSYAVLQNDGDGPSQWKLEAIIPLPLGSCFHVMGVAGGYFLLQGIPKGFFSIPMPERPDLNCYSVNLRTLQLECFCGTRYAMILPPLYAGFPPSLSPPTI